MSTVEMMNRGMEYLVEKLGEVDAEQFISIIIREQFDYTKWRRQAFSNMTPEEFHRAAIEYDRANPTGPM